MAEPQISAPRDPGATNPRSCYCGLWETQPEVLRAQGLAKGFCGLCQRCGKPGHTRHFPGPVPYTGAWCDGCYRIVGRQALLQRSLSWLFMVAIAGIIWFFVRKFF